MNKKIFVLGSMAALLIGAASTVALQSHAQNVSPQAAITATVPAVTPQTQTAAIAPDTDNIQNDNGGIDKPDAVVSSPEGESEANAMDVPGVESSD